MGQYHNRIMNIPPANKEAHVFYESDIEWVAYKFGHRDARHAAAEIALEAEREIEDLKYTLNILRFWTEGSLSCETHSWDQDQREAAEWCVQYAKELLEKTK